MEIFLTRHRRHLLQRLPRIALGFFAAGVLLSMVQGIRWAEAHRLNQAYLDGSLIRHAGQPDMAPTEAYAVGLLLARKGQRQEAAKHFTLAEASPDPATRARAKFALGNLYFGIALKAADIQSGLGHIHGLAQIDIAREAYKGALRIDPGMSSARYNLELLDRLSPPKRIEGWERETDGVTLVPQKRDGWASMKDNTRRGLP